MSDQIVYAGSLRLREMRLFERANRLHIGSLSQEHAFPPNIEIYGRMLTREIDRIFSAVNPSPEMENSALRRFRDVNNIILGLNKSLEVPRQPEDLSAEYQLFAGLFAWQKQGDIVYSLERLAAFGGPRQKVRKQEKKDEILAEHMEYLIPVLRGRNGGKYEPLHHSLTLSPGTMEILQTQANTPFSPSVPAIRARPPRSPQPGQGS